MSEVTDIFGVSAPPPIPAVRSDTTGLPRRPVLYWVRTGLARVRVDEVELRLGPGEGVWIPESGWSRLETDTEPGTVVFPVLPHQADPSVTEPTRFEVPAGWQDWLIQLFNLQTTPLSDRGYPRDSVAGLLR